jgi:hypothetical protein
VAGRRGSALRADRFGARAGALELAGGEFQKLSPLHRQMYWVYGGYVILSIVAFGLISLTTAAELASGDKLARAFCLYVAISGRSA